MESLLADLVVLVHLGIVLFMLAGILVVPVGGLLRWRWVRRPVWRLVHLAIMAYIVFNAARDELCFLTHWERDLRAAAGQDWRTEGSYVGRLLHDILFVDVEQHVLHRIYFVVGALVAISWIFVRPRFRRRAEVRGADAQSPP